MKVKILYKVIVITSIFFTVLLMPKLPIHLLTNVLRLILILIIIIEMVLLFKELVIDTKLSEKLKKTAIVLVTVLIFGLLLESFFMFMPRSHGVGYTLACRLWFNKYWNPINSYNYRDIEPKINKNEYIIFVGDSFTAGHGIKRIKDRFPDIVRNKLIEDNRNIQVINLSKDGIDTKDEFDAMMNYIKTSNQKPDFIVLQYCGNDIEKIAVKNGFKWVGPNPYQGVNPILRQIIKGSYLLNYFYWLFPRYDVNKYFKFLINAYSNDTVFSKHLNDIEAFNNFSISNRVPLLVVIFPFLQSLDLSDRVFVNKLTQYFENRGIEYINVGLLCKELPIMERIVNNNDGHASVKLNRIVAEEIYRAISKRIIENDNNE